MKTLLTLILCTFLVQGCATGYQKNGMSGGYTETRLGENIFMVTFRGNGFTSSEKASDFALLRSAELALENGYSYFEIVDANSHISTSSYTTPTTSTTTANAYGYGNYAYGTARTTTYGGQTYNISKPSSLKPSSIFLSRTSLTKLTSSILLNRNGSPIIFTSGYLS